MRAKQKLTSCDGNFVRHTDWAEIPWQPVRHDFQVCPWRHLRKTLAALSSEWLKISPRQLSICQPEGPNGVCRKRTNVSSLFWGGMSNYSSPWYWNPWLFSFGLHQSPGPSASYWAWLCRLFLPTGCGIPGSSSWLGVSLQTLLFSDLAAPDFKALQFVSEITVGSWDSSTSITIWTNSLDKHLVIIHICPVDSAVLETSLDSTGKTSYPKTDMLLWSPGYILDSLDNAEDYRDSFLWVLFPEFNTI